MAESAAPGINVRFFDWRTALSGRYDVLHIHWPEYLVRGEGKKDALAALIRVPLLARRIRRDKIAVVRTLHNLTPHEAGHRLEPKLTAMLSRTVHKNIALNRATELDESEQPEVILHGDYIERFSGIPRAQQVDGRVLYFGLLRRYKGVDALVSAFESAADPSMSLRLVGRPQNQAMRDSVARLSASDPRITSDLRFVPDGDLVREVSQAQLVVLPYREMHNSGSLLVALSLGRPVLTIDTPVNRSIQEEVGPGWIWLYEGDLTSDRLVSALNEVRSLARAEGEVPQFDERDWASVGRKHRRVYEDAVRLARGSR
ncbi:glycosyltransferase [Microbacterium sp. E-13]|uniref:glycosyltransferase n=1 Tax=Microbacterium sp. E-13 TaxID=3404048 RepID=UPI003CEA06EF